MQSFNLIQNELMSMIDNQSRSPEPESALKNTLKTLVKRNVQTTYSTGQIYNKKVAFDIPREYDNLSQLYLKVTLSTGSVACDVDSYFATKIFKEIQLRTKQGTVLQTLNPQYLSARLDEIYSTGLYTNIALSIEPDQLFVNGDPTCFVPLFFFFSESIETALRTRSLEALEIVATTNNDYGSMGLSIDLTSINFELYYLYHDENTSSKITDVIYTEKSIPREIVSSYNIFQEDPQVIATGATSARLLLRCPFPTFALHISLVDANSNRFQVKTMSLTVGGTTIVNLDYRINYDMFGANKAYLENGSFTYFFSRNRRRCADSGLITFSRSMFPCYLDITFDALLLIGSIL